MSNPDDFGGEDFPSDPAELGRMMEDNARRKPLDLNGLRAATALGRGPKSFLPPVCTGSGTVATDLQGVKMLAHIPSTGVCGICGGVAQIDGDLRLVTHAWVAKP